MYTDASIDRIREVDLIEVISKYVDLKKSGSTFKGLSPFVSEKTPSFMVSPAKGLWKCFASGKGGADAISFVMQKESFNFIDAVKTISQICNIHLEEENVPEEVQKARTQKDSFKAINNNVAEEFARQLSSLPKNHWAKKHLESIGYTQDEIITFQLGYTPGNGLVSKNVINSAKLDIALSLGLVKSERGTSYDFFFDRIMFPIHNVSGQVIGFGGRCSREKQSETAKYLNSKDSLIYNKSNALYGIYQARKSIIKSNVAILVEGYTDVVTMHQFDASNTIATCGTALTPEQAKTISRLADEIIVFRDGDTAGITAALRDIDILLATGKKITVVISPEGEDPDTICRKQNVKDFITENKTDALLWKANYYLNEAGDDPTDKAHALEKVIETLTLLESDIIRKDYVKKIAKLYGHSARDVEKSVKKYISDKYEEAKRKEARSGNNIDDALRLPKGADIEEFREKGFVTVGNFFYVPTKSGWSRAGNFKLTSLFHIDEDKDTPRLFDAINEVGEKALVSMESSIVLNFSSNQNRLLDFGNFTWDIDISSREFKLIMHRLVKECIKVKPFSYFGWQSKGFWAFSNGVYNEGVFQEVNEYGIVSVEGIEEIKSEYYNNTPYYYSPAFNVTNRFKEDDQDMYQNDRSFVYKKAPVNFNAWMLQLQKVYTKKANIAIGFCVATIFKDIIMNRHSFFPLLFCTGEKGSGKSMYSESIANLFTYKQKAFTIDSGSKVGFFRRLQRGRNTATVMEEFHDKIDLEKFQALKAAWDGRGREIGMMSNDSRTKVSDVRCSLVIVGQYLSSRDDNSLTSRSIIQHFIKPTESFTTDQIEAKDLLLEWEEQGLTSLVLELVKYRNLMEADFHKAFAKNSKKFKVALEKFEYQERMLQNYNAIYTPVSILYQYFEFPFELNEYFLQCVNGIIDNSDLLVESEGLSEFWNTIGKLAETPYPKLVDGQHYVIKTPHEQKLQGKKGEAEQLYKNTDRHRILYLRINSVHQDYADAVSKRDGVDVIGEATLKNYFKSKRYFIGAVKAERFNNDPGLVTSCYAFNYDMMVDNNILQLPKYQSRKADDVVRIADPEDSQTELSI